MFYADCEGLGSLAEPFQGGRGVDREAGSRQKRRSRETHALRCPTSPEEGGEDRRVVATWMLWDGGWSRAPGRGDPADRVWSEYDPVEPDPGDATTPL